jgi:IS5 family transposase
LRIGAWARRAVARWRIERLARATVPIQARSATARHAYRSLVKNALQLQLLAVALNLRRALALTARGWNLSRAEPQRRS